MKNHSTEKRQYQVGFGNHFATEALTGALPQKQNSPQKCAYGLYAEQISGTAFTAPRAENLRSWCYRILPSVVHEKFVPTAFPYFETPPFHSGLVSPNQLRWDPFPLPAESNRTEFLEGIRTYTGAGDTKKHYGCAVHLYSCNRSMERRFFCNVDGDFLFVPETGDLLLKTEMGELELSPGEIAVIPRGIKFSVELKPSTQVARGYLCENFGMAFRLPNLGPIGSNGLANARDFLIPVAHYEEEQNPFQFILKMNGQFWTSTLPHSPFDVVAWHGNYYPYKYDLSCFNTINTVSFDHPDPSIFTVLTSPSEQNGVANIDFVIFPPRWMAAEHSFRPPYYHRNIMSEFMGLIRGKYDAKETGFLPAGASLHNSFSAHGPDSESFEKASKRELHPEYYADTLAFMFETSLLFSVTSHALESSELQKNYLHCWKSLQPFFYSHSKDQNL